MRTVDLATRHSDLRKENNVERTGRQKPPINETYPGKTDYVLFIFMRLTYHVRAAAFIRILTSHVLITSAEHFVNVRGEGVTCS